MYELSCLDVNGSYVSTMYQWEEYRTIYINDVLFEEGMTYKVHICNMCSKEAFVITPTIKNGKLIIRIPTLLMEGRDTIDVYVYRISNDTDEKMVVGTFCIHIKERHIPSDYQSAYTKQFDNYADGLVKVGDLIYLSSNGVPFGEGCRFG